MSVHWQPISEVCGVSSGLGWKNCFNSSDRRPRFVSPVQAVQCIVQLFLCLLCFQCKYGMHRDLPRKLVQHRCSPGQALGKNEPCAQPLWISQVPGHGASFQQFSSNKIMALEGCTLEHWELPIASLQQRGRRDLCYTSSLSWWSTCSPRPWPCLLLRGHKHKFKGCKELSHIPSSAISGCCVKHQCPPTGYWIMGYHIQWKKQQISAGQIPSVFRIWFCPKP